MKKTSSRIIAVVLTILCMVLTSSPAVYADSRPEEELTQEEIKQVDALKYRENVLANLIKYAAMADMDDASFETIFNWANKAQEEAEYQIKYIEADNEEKVYLYFTEECGYSPAVACGIMANISKECGFNANANGISGYGLCQWCGSRRTACQNYIKNNNLDIFEGQLNFIAKELNSYCSGVKDSLTALDNTKNGAIQAGAIFCRDFERPLFTSYNCSVRGQLAGIFWDKYVNN